jgi:hypothetical protein
MGPDDHKLAMIYHLSDKTYDLTCKDFDYTGVPCCETCHDDWFSQYELRVVLIDGKLALLCCTKIAFFYPDDPNIALSPEEKLLRAIFGEKATHEQSEEDD